MTDVASKPQPEEEVPNLNLSHITNGETERGIPLAKFIENVDDFARTFQPPAQAELLIGAYSDLMNRYKVYETRLSQKRKFGSAWRVPVPDTAKLASVD